MDLSLPRGAIKTSRPSCIPSQQLSRVHLSKGRCRSLLRGPTKGRFARHNVAPEICSLSVLVLQGSGWPEIRGIFLFLQPGGFLMRVLVRRPSRDEEESDRSGLQPSESRSGRHIARGRSV